MKELWGKKYTLPFKIWDQNWNNIATFFKYPEEIRYVIYTTNAVEALHRQFRKVTKAKWLFQNDDSQIKMLYLAYKDLSKKWKMPVKKWAFIIAHLSVIFNDRITKLIL